MPQQPSLSSTSPPIKPTSKSARSGTWKLIRNRIVAGLFVVLPVLITFYVIQWLYDFFTRLLIAPIAGWLIESWFGEGVTSPKFVEYFLAPVAALFLVGAALYVAGIFFNSRLHRLFDWFLNTVPGVNYVYSIVSNVFEAVQRSNFGADDFKRVVLVEFPHPGMKAPAFVTAETTDQKTGQNILCIYVPTTPVPTSGYMLMVPESDVVALDWDLQETLQAIVSGGITAPKSVQYYPN